MIWTQERLTAAGAEAERWLGQHHVDRMAKFGIGIDCIHYVLEILVAADLVSRVPIGPYETREGQWRESTRLQKELMKCLHATAHDPKEAQAGDIVVFRNGKVSAHCGWLGLTGLLSSGANPVIYHSLATHGVVKSIWPLWRHDAAVAIRIFRAGWRERRTV